MSSVTFLIKPASSLCNLRCAYCFYRDVSEKRHTASFGIMSKETTEELIRKAFALDRDVVTFGFQGGEPTLAGLDYFESFIQLVDQYNTRGIPVQYTIQTNGTTIDGKWAKFYAEHKFLVGVSIDGTPEIHDAYRVDAKGKGTLQTILFGLKQLEKHGCEYNILYVVNNLVASKAAQVYRFFRSKKLRFLQFIPCMNPLGEEETRYEYSLTSENFEKFLKTTFDLWYKDFYSSFPISVRSFDNYVGMIAGYPPESCAMGGVCGCYFLVEADGSTYPCDFYVLDDYKLGNVCTESLTDMMKNPKVAHFIRESANHPQECRSCKWYAMCRNGCKRNRDPKTGRNLYCEAYYAFFEYAYPRMAEIARRCLPPSQ